MSESYPERLIPNRNLVLITNESLDKSDKLGVWVDSEQILKDEDGSLNGGVTNLKRIPKFSTNKIPDSIPNDLNIKFNEDCKDLFDVSWQEGESGLYPQPHQFYFIDERQHYFLNISDLDGYEDTYYNPPGQTNITFTFILKVVHKPLVANYWHFEFEIIADDKAIEKNKSTWINNICASIRGLLVKKAIFEI